MQWKVNLRRALEANGHRIAPIHRDSIKRKGVSLAQSDNVYRVACDHCYLNTLVYTTPGLRTEVRDEILKLKCPNPRPNRNKESTKIINILNGVMGEKISF